MENLTGRTRLRSNWRGKIFLQVEFELSYTLVATSDIKKILCWRDAKTEDLWTFRDIRISPVDQPEVKRWRPS